MQHPSPRKPTVNGISPTQLCVHTLLFLTVVIPAAYLLTESGDHPLRMRGILKIMTSSSHSFSSQPAYGCEVKKSPLLTEILKFLPNFRKKKFKPFSRNEYISQMKTWMDYTLLVVCGKQTLTLYTLLAWVASLTVHTSCLLSQSQGAFCNRNNQVLHRALRRDSVATCSTEYSNRQYDWDNFRLYSLSCDPVFWPFPFTHTHSHAFLHAAHRHCIRWKFSDGRL